MRRLFAMALLGFGLDQFSPLAALGVFGMLVHLSARIARLTCPVTGQVVPCLPSQFIFIFLDQIIGRAAGVVVFIEKFLPFSKLTEAFDNGKPLSFFQSPALSAQPLSVPINLGLSPCRQVLRTHNPLALPKLDDDLATDGRDDFPKAKRGRKNALTCLALPLYEGMTDGRWNLVIFIGEFKKLVHLSARSFKIVV